MYFNLMAIIQHLSIYKMSFKTKLLKISDTLNGYPDYIMIGIVFFISILALLPAWINYDIISTDGVYFYIPVARLFLEGNFHEALYGKLEPLFPLPLYEILIFITAKITGFSLETSSRLVASSAYVLGSIGIYKITKQIANNRITALISVLFYLSNRKLLEYSVDCLKESLLICLILWANFLIIKGINSSSRKKSDLLYLRCIPVFVRCYGKGYITHFFICMVNYLDFS